jgi:hypothetical protein
MAFPEQGIGICKVEFEAFPAGIKRELWSCGRAGLLSSPSILYLVSSHCAVATSSTAGPLLPSTCTVNSCSYIGSGDT